MSNLVEVRREDGVALVTMNQPKTRNALGLELYPALLREISSLQDDRACRAIVLTGSQGCFSSGGDVNALHGSDPLGARRMMSDIHRIVRAIVSGPAPVFAAVEGAAFGAGFSLALACDFVVADSRSRFCAAFGRVGLVPDLGLLWTLPQRVGIGVAREIFMFADVIEGRQARELNLVEYFVEDGQTVPFALERARKLAERPPGTIGMTKAFLSRWPMDLDTLLAWEASQQALMLTTADYEEGKNAFLEKRQARFSGH